MQRVLSLLLAFVFFQTQAWALSGGPVYAGDQQSLVGTYAGVIVPDLVMPRNPNRDPSTVFGANSLGVFALGVPETNLAQGAIVFFLEGSFFQGGIVGLADPNEGKLFGLAQIVRVVAKQVQQPGTGGGGGIAIAFDARADGTIEADISDQNQFSLRLSGSGTFALKILDFTTFEFEDQGSFTVAVEGFRQSTDVTLPDPNSTAGLLNQ